MMSEEEIQVHLKAGEAYGRDATCGTKVNYAGEERAVLAAKRLSEKYRRDLEGYPCFWCKGWHIGRAMTKEEWAEFS
jgi:hypothetical protein